MIAYKVLEEKDGKPHFIFHGVNGSRQLPINEWLKAENKKATDGSNLKEYVSGFHCFENEESIARWLRFVHEYKSRYVCEVEIKKTRLKSHSRDVVVLADYIKISAHNWQNRKPLTYFRKETL